MPQISPISWMTVFFLIILLVSMLFTNLKELKKSPKTENSMVPKKKSLKW